MPDMIIQSLSFPTHISNACPKKVKDSTSRIMSPYRLAIRPEYDSYMPKIQVNLEAGISSFILIGVRLEDSILVSESDTCFGVKYGGYKTVRSSQNLTVFS